MQDYEKHQRMLRRRRFVRAAFAWLLLGLAAWFVVIGIWAMLVVLIGMFG